MQNIASWAVPFMVLAMTASATAVAADRGPGAKPVAEDGVVQIDQQRAINGKVTAGDEKGFPVTISEPGSYRLTSNLNLQEAGADFRTDAIIITAANVTLDLNGFEIVGLNACSGIPPEETVTCTYESVFIGSGIDAQQYVTIRNGTVRNMTFFSVLCRAGCRIENVTARDSWVGIGTSGRSTITGSLAERNGATGISTNTGRTGSVVENNVAFGNGGAGFFLGNGDTVRGNTATRNGGTGIFSNGGTLVNNNASLNLDGGIRILRGTVLENTMYNNGGVGFFGGAAVGYAGNTIITRAISFPTATTVGGSPKEIGQNLCGDESGADPIDTTCP